MLWVLKVSLAGCISAAGESVPTHGESHRSNEFKCCRNVNCFNGWGAVLILGETRRSHKECLSDCKAKSECEGISVMYRKSEEQCVMIKKVRTEECKTGAAGTDIWLKNSSKGHMACPLHTHPKQVPTVQPIGNFKCVANTNCYQGHGAKPIPGIYYEALARHECMRRCSHLAACEGVVVPSSTSLQSQWQCWLLTDVKANECAKGPGYSFCRNRDLAPTSLADWSKAWFAAMSLNGSASVWSTVLKSALMCTTVLLSLHVWRRRRSQETSGGELTLASGLEQLALRPWGPRAARNSTRSLRLDGDDEEVDM
eukprot:TRINITY_DN16558_c0_g1_i1.p1 TRINITY_DN16558_c0_g1~~TRINITY_DN16558_c0_g1_i1.p1  ORF type:complete len:312 (-),score=42.37 TRINITY_DN16558_c0_g1_i1:385-1320(-)